MAVTRLQTAKVKPRALDTLIIDKVLFPLTVNQGRLGYMRDGTFVPVAADQLLKHPVSRAGAVTWFIKPVGRERVRLPNT